MDGLYGSMGRGIGNQGEDEGEFWVLLLGARLENHRRWLDR